MKVSTKEKKKANELWQERNHTERSHVSTFPTEKALADCMDSDTQRYAEPAMRWPDYWF